MDNPFVTKNEYCGKCIEYNDLIKEYIKNLDQSGLANTSLGMSFLIDDIMKNNEGKTPDCAKDICGAIVNIYDNENLLEMKKSFDLVDKGKTSKAIKHFKELKKKYQEKSGGDS